MNLLEWQINELLAWMDPEWLGIRVEERNKIVLCL